LDVGDEVEFTINRKNPKKLSAENIAKLKNNSIKPNYSLLSGTYKGKIVQTLRSQIASSLNGQDTNPGDDNYYGKIQLIGDKKDQSENATYYQYGMFSLNDKKSHFQIGDLVTFQLIALADSNKKAFNISLTNQQESNQQQQQYNQRNSRSNDFKKGKVESIKGHVSAHLGFFFYILNIFF
jgi:hypothetical protein